jgi:hypothetical protein
MRDGQTHISALPLAFICALSCSPCYAQSGTRDPFLQPFSSQSIWNTPVGDQIAFVAESDPMTLLLRNQNAGGPGGSFAWIGRDAMSVVLQSETDPLATWQYKGRSATSPWSYGGPIANGSFQIKTPRNLQFYGNDRYGIIVTSNKHQAVETWSSSYVPATNSYQATYVVQTDLYGTGIASRPNTSEGIRAFGGSLLGGLIRCSELDAASIPHAIAVVISPNQAKAGTRSEDQRVWPASVTDNGSTETYKGLIPMGAMIAIPQSIDLTTLGLSAEGLALARAYQNFGGYVVDTATNTLILASLDAGCNATKAQNLANDKTKILSKLRIVSNQDESHVGGPGNRVVPPPPPLPSN